MPQRREHRVPVPGGELHVVVEGDGPAILLVHGFALDHRTWDRVAVGLAGTRRVIRPDLRGHGRSSLPVGPYAHREDMAQVLDHLGVLRADVCGLSVGGVISLELGVSAPARVRSLILVDPFGFVGVPFPPAVRDTFRSARAAARKGDLKGSERAWRESPWLAPALARVECRDLLLRMTRDYSGFHLREPDPGRFLEPLVLGRLDEIRVPTLVLVGALDTPENHEVARRVASGVRGARLETIAGAAHMPPLEEPEGLLAALKPFLEGASPPGADL